MIVRESIKNVLKPKSSEEIDEVVNELSNEELVNRVISQKTTDLVDYALKRTLSPELNGELLKWSVSQNSKSLVKKILKKEIDPQKFGSAVSDTLKNKPNFDILNILIEYPKFDPSYRNNQLLRWAASNGHGHLVNILMKHPKVDPSDLNNSALVGADVYEHKDIIKRLLQDERVIKKLNSKQMKQYGLNESIGNILRPKSKEDIHQAALAIEDPNELLQKAVTTIQDPELVKIAIERGADPNRISSDVTKVNNEEIIRLLLTNPKMKISTNSLIYKAVKIGLDDEIIKLIKNDKLDPGQKSTILLVWAVGFARNKLVNVLLKDNRVKPENEKESVAEALSIAIARGNNDLVIMLLKDKRVDPSGDYNRPIKVASQFGNVEIVKELLKDERVNPAAEDSDGTLNFSIRQAEDTLNFSTSNSAKKKYKEIIALLINDSRVQKSMNLSVIDHYRNLIKTVRESIK